MSETAYGSDVVVRTLEGLGVTCAALNPGASFRGLHASVAAIPESLARAWRVAVTDVPRPAGTPFGGWKHSGVGKESCLEELLSHTREMSVVAAYPVALADHGGLRATGGTARTGPQGEDAK